MAKYSGKGPISRQDLKRAKLEAKRARAAKMDESPMPVKRKKVHRYGTKKNNTKLWIIIGAAAAAVAILGMIVFLVASQRPSDEELLGYVSDGVYANTTTIEDVDVSGMTLDEARNALSDTLKRKIEGGDITFTFNGESHTESAMTFGFVTDVEDILVDAMLYEKSGTYFDRKKKLKTAETEGVSYAISLIADEATVSQAVASITSNYQVPAVEPKMTFDPNAETEEETITWSDEENGLSLDEAAFTAAVMAAVQSGNFDLGVVDAVVLEPHHTKADMADSVVKISTYTSFFGFGSYDDKNRVANLELMSSVLSGTAIEPGETFSINEATGERTEEKGYKEANSIRSGVMIKELGGGVCQVAGTLYNAYLLAELGIVERHAHSHVSDYINITGRHRENGDSGGFIFDYVTTSIEEFVAVDATVDYGNKDLVVRNTLSDTIYIVVTVDEETETLTASIYGPPREEDYTVVVRTLLHKTIEPSAATERLIAEEGYAPDGTFVPVGRPYTYKSRRNGLVYWTYVYHYPAGYDFLEDPNPMSWIGYDGENSSSGEKTRITYDGNDKYIDSYYPEEAGVVYYNPSDPEASDLPGYVPPAPEGTTNDDASGSDG
ncbi:MAG: VanW family protein [Eubacteriales bacterium]